MKSLCHLLVCASFCIPFCVVELGSSASASDTPAGLSASANSIEIESLEERAEIVKMIASAIQSNFEKIKTWKGTYSFQDRQYLDVDVAKKFFEVAGGNAPDILSPVTARSTGLFEFAYDAEQEKVFSAAVSLTPTQYRDITSNKVILEVKASPQRSIFSKEYYLHLALEENYGELHSDPNILPREGPVAFREASNEAFDQRYALAFDPRLLFYCEKPLVEIFSQVQIALADGEELDGKLSEKERELTRKFIRVFRVEKEPGHVIYRIQIGPHPDNVNTPEQTFSVDSLYGFNVFEVTTFMGTRLLTQMDWKYKLTDGVYLPSYFRRMASTNDGEYSRFDRILELRDSRLNEALPESTFSYASLGLVDGDRLKDMIEDRVYVLRDDALRTPERIAAIDDSTYGQSTRWMLIANIVVVVFLSIVMLRSYWRR